MNTHNDLETVQKVFLEVKDHTQLPPLVVRGISNCVQSAFEGGVTQEDTYHHMQGDVVTIDVRKNGQEDEVLAFSSTSFGSPNDILKASDISDTQGCYLAGATVSKEAQSSGLYKKMNETRIGFALEKKLDLVFTRTQNPRVQSGIQAILQDMVEKGKIDSFYLERKLIKGCYGQMLTKTKPIDDKVSFDELDYENGDAYVLLFNIKHRE